MMELLKTEPIQLTWANYWAITVADQIMWEERGDASTKVIAQDGEVTTPTNTSLVQHHLWKTCWEHTPSMMLFGVTLTQVTC